MLEDRDYMRSDYGSAGRWTASPTIILLVINTVVFVLQSINHAYIHSPIESMLALSGEGLKHLYLWQLVTFQFLHLNFSHFFFNSFALYMFGRPVERALGNGRFWEIYFLSGITGGLLQAALGILFPGFFGGDTVGASAGVSGLVAAFCLKDRNAIILLFFFLPVRAGYLLIGALAVAAFFTLVPSETGIAHAAHLGGMLATIGYFRWILGPERRLFNWRSYADVHAEERKRPVANRKTFRQRVIPTAPEIIAPKDFVSAEVDPILDKISAHGIQSLTERERKILDSARTKMSKR
jgi:membrane associated rhomboid family serine protease